MNDKNEQTQLNKKYRNIFVVEIDGRGVLVFNAQSAATTDGTLEEGGIRERLKEHRDNDGRPLWDGRSEIQIREATPSEAEVWADLLARLVSDGQLEPTPICAATLMPVLEPAVGKPHSAGAGTFVQRRDTKARLKKWRSKYPLTDVVEAIRPILEGIKRDKPPGDEAFKRLTDELNALCANRFSDLTKDEWFFALDTAIDDENYRNPTDDD
jgi:hypothetical protein